MQLVEHRQLGIVSIAVREGNRVAPNFPQRLLGDADVGVFGFILPPESAICSVRQNGEVKQTLQKIVPRLILFGASIPRKWTVDDQGGVEGDFFELNRFARWC